MDNMIVNRSVHRNDHIFLQVEEVRHVHLVHFIHEINQGDIAANENVYYQRKN